MYLGYTILSKVFSSFKQKFEFWFSTVTSGCYNKIGFTINFIVYGKI